MDKVSYTNWQPLLDLKSYADFTRKEQFELTAIRVCRLGKLLFKNKADEQVFVRALGAFNTSWTNLLHAQKDIAFIKKGSSEVKFSSCHKDVFWLSNFFETLVYDSTRECCARSVEHLYVYFKMNQNGEIQIDFDEVGGMDPKQIKSFGSHHRIPQDKVATDEMKRLVELKFAQNPMLRSLLKQTGKLPLREHTNDAFWGTAMGTSGQNQLGEILMGIRANLK